ncbi:MAG: ChaN family lipoprotein [Burkholderiales bacterium]
MTRCASRLLISAIFLGSALQALAEDSACLAPGQWRVPAARPVVTDAAAVISAARNGQFVLLGEQHDEADHHRWQLHALAMLHAARPQMAIGLEMLPRRAQPVLDRWVAGELTEAEFVRESDWSNAWGYDASLYLPILHFARLHRIPLIALNVERELTREVGRNGWAAIPAERREGVGDPAPASEAYRSMLQQWFGYHRDEAEAANAIDFRHFVEAQLTWDRAMAEALFSAAKHDPTTLVVGIIGSGHLRHGYGVPHQLRALGAKRVTVWLPLSAETPCDRLTAGLADAVFAVGSSSESVPQRLGVVLDESEGGPRVREVAAGSVAERAGVLSGDRVISAAGVRIASAAELVTTIKRQPPGTWLPLLVDRKGQSLELVAKFPAAAR